MCVTNVSGAWATKPMLRFFLLLVFSVEFHDHTISRPPLLSASNTFNDFCGNAADKDVIGDVLCYDRSRGGNDIIADGHARHDMNARAEPDVIADFDRISVFQSCITLFGN